MSPIPQVPTNCLPLHQSARLTRRQLFRLHLVPLRTLLHNSPSSSRSLLFSSKVRCNPRGPIRSRPLASPIVFQDASGVTVRTIRKGNVPSLPTLPKRDSSGTISKIASSMAPQAKKSHICLTEEECRSSLRLSLHPQPSRQTISHLNPSLNLGTLAQF